MSTENRVLTEHLETEQKKRFTFHIAETRHFEFEVWARDEDEAREMGIDIWRAAATVGQWELPDTETEYEVCRHLAKAEGGSS